MTTPTPPVPTPTAAVLERIARQLVKDADTEAKSARVLAITNATPRKRRTTTDIVTDGDVYAALDRAAEMTPTTANAVAVITCGWAAPVTADNHADTAPSLHPKRQRVCLVSVHHLDTGDTVSAIRFAARPGIVVDHGTAHGALADAVTTLGNQIRANRAN